MAARARWRAPRRWAPSDGRGTKFPESANPLHLKARTHFTTEDATAHHDARCRPATGPGFVAERGCLEVVTEEGKT